MRRLLWTPVALLICFEGLHRYARSDLPGDPIRRLAAVAFSNPLNAYRNVRFWFLDGRVFGLPNWVWAGTLAGLLIVAAVWGSRKAWLWFDENVRSRILGTRFRRETWSFRFKPFDAGPCVVLDEPSDQTFLGLDGKGRPLELLPHQRETHIEILGQTGSGKSRLLEVMIFQDMRAGRGVMFLDGKGDETARRRFCGMAQANGRLEEVRLFDLSDPARSWTYNPAFVRLGRDPVVVAEKLFSVFECSDPYYRNVQESFFTLLVSVAHSTGKEFTIRDLHRAIRSPDAMELLCEEAPRGGAVEDLLEGREVLGPRAGNSLAGLETWLRRYSIIPQINAYRSLRSIDLEEEVAAGRLIYVRLPAGYRQVYAAAIGRLFLQDLQFIAGARQVFGGKDLRPFAIYVDEFGVFADRAWINAVNKARSARLWWTVAHQSLADLEAVSREFSSAVLDNCRTRIVLAQRNPKLCQHLADELGTVQVIERTERYSKGPFFSRTATAEASTRQVDAYRLHPNRIKNLHPFGQGYVVGDLLRGAESYVGVNFGLLDIAETDVSPPAVSGKATRGLGLAARHEAARNKNRERGGVHYDREAKVGCANGASDLFSGSGGLGTGD